MVARVVVHAKIDERQLRELATGASGPVWQSVQRGAGRGRDLAKLELTIAGLIDTGQLRNQIESTVELRGQDLVGRITSHARHSIFVHKGTDGPILPRRARALRFTVRGGGVVYAASVRGTRETGNWTPFLADARDKLTIGDFM